MFIQTVTNKVIRPFHAIADVRDEWGNTMPRTVRQGGFATKEAAVAALKNKVGHVLQMVQGKNVTVYIKTAAGEYHKGN